MSNSNLEMSIVPILISQINGQKIAIRSPDEHNRAFGHWLCHIKYVFFTISPLLISLSPVVIIESMG